jgi:hypothetical protein
MQNTHYKIIHKKAGSTILKIGSEDTVWSFPEDLSNRHYEEYLEWLAEGNTPEVVEEVVE